MLPDFIDQKTAYTIIHIFGAILGAGGAFAGDAMFMSTIRDGRIYPHELRFMKIGGKLAWTGLILLIVSGALLVTTDPTSYLTSGKFLAKMTVVGVIAGNGAVFHLIHIPRIRDHLGVKFADSPAFVRSAPYLLASGAVSMVSWVSAVILGVLKDIPYGYGQIIGVYLILIGCAVTTAVLARKRVLGLK